MLITFPITIPPNFSRDEVLGLLARQGYVVEQDQVMLHSRLGNETVIGRADGYTTATAVEVNTGSGDRGLDRILGQVDWLRLKIASVLGELPVVRRPLENLLQNGRG